MVRLQSYRRLLATEYGYFDMAVPVNLAFIFFLYLVINLKYASLICSLSKITEVVKTPFECPKNKTRCDYKGQTTQYIFSIIIRRIKLAKTISTK